MGAGRDGSEDLEKRYQQDLVTFAPGDHDVRVARGGWVYYVRALRGTERLLGPGVGVVAALVAFTTVLVTNALSWPWNARFVVVYLLAALAVGWWRARRVRDRPWEVGVVRGPDPATWNAGPPVVVHTEQLDRALDPTARVAELAEDSRAGRFDPHT